MARPVIALRARSVASITTATLFGLGAVLWPFVATPGHLSRSYAAPLLFGALLLLVLLVVLAEIADGGLDPKALAMLGVLSAIGAALRPLGAGTAGVETVFFVVVIAGRVFGAGFGFCLGCTTLLSSALITAGVGPWLPYQMFASAVIGLGAGWLPAARGRAEVLLLAGYGAVSAYVVGLVLNLSSWPFSVDPTSSIAYRPGAPIGEQFHRYLAFDATTSLGWDTGRAVTTFVCIVLAGPAVLVTLRRWARRAAFHAAVHFPDAVQDGGAWSAEQQAAPGVAAHGPSGRAVLRSRPPHEHSREAL